MHQGIAIRIATSWTPRSHRWLLVSVALPVPVGIRAPSMRRIRLARLLPADECLEVIEVRCPMELGLSSPRSCEREATIRPSDDLRFSYQRRSGRVPSAISRVSGQAIREPILLARHMANLTRAKAFSQRLGEVVQQLQVRIAHAVVP